jgi:hypothetical protein|tara:strand:- start:11412 stop:12815 length:1404 start_codon:yes stop_codon:yes gene_type:complete
MTPDDLKRYNVSVGSGSGCFFQPMTEEYTYILTAKHLFQNERKNEDTAVITYEPLAEGTPIEIFKNVKTDHGWLEESIPFHIDTGINYFPHPHPDVDCAILKIPPESGFEDILVEDNIDRNLDYQLCGFPSDNHLNQPGERDSILKVEGILASGNFSHRAQLLGNINYENIVGMSGGGYLKIGNNHLTILGVQSKMATKAAQALGQVGFIPMKYFTEIIKAQEDEGTLEHLLPAYLRSFSFFDDEIFNIVTGPQELIVARKVKLTRILKIKAAEIRDSDITPNYIKDHLQDKLLLLDQNNFELQKRGIWKMWLELLTILNIAKNRAHSLADMPDIFEKVRMFFSDVNADFWTTHLADLHKLDFSGLEHGGIVIVASNSPCTSKEMDILDLSKIPSHIAEARNDYAMRHLGQEIDVASEFPLEKYKFINISAFKESAVVELDEKFDNSLPNESLATIKQLYEQFIPEW